MRGGRRGEHAESSRTFSSVTDSLLLHKTCRVRRPPLQLRLHSDHSPVHQLQADRGSKYRNRPAGGATETRFRQRGNLFLKQEDKSGNESAGNEATIMSEFLFVTSGSTAQCCTISAFLWACSSCRRSDCRRLCDPSASCTPPAGSGHLKTTRS